MTYNYANFPMNMDADLFSAFRDGAPRAGSRAPRTELQALDGTLVKLKDLWKSGPLVVEFGSFT